MRSAHAPEASKAAGAWESFRRWRRVRPFWGGLLLILSGVELFLSGNLNLGAMQVHIGPTGFLSYVVPAMVVLCGAGSWITPNLRLFYGILGSLVAVYSLIGVNLGGFLVGLLLGIIGGALTIAWTPILVTTPTAGAPTEADEPGADEPGADEPEAGEPAGYASAPAAATEQGTEPQPRYDHGQPYGNVSAYGDTAEIPIPRQVQDPERWWGSSPTGSRQSEEEPPPYGTSSGGNHSRLLAITLVPVTLAAVLLTIFHQPESASAAPCPTPRVSAAATPKASPSKTGQAAAPQSGAASGTPQPAPSGSLSASPNSASSADSKGSGNPLVDAWNGLVDGVSKLFGGGKESTPTAAPSPSPSPSASTSASSVLPGLSAVPVPPNLPGGASSRPQASKSASTGSCITSAAADPGQLPASLFPGLLTGSSQVMDNFTYEGVTDLPTKTGTMKVLKFTMSKAVTTPFSLKMGEPISGKSTLITSTQLTTEGSVTFYTPKFTGTLAALGLPVIPISIPLPPILTSTYTPESQPPLPPHLTFSSIKFTNVTIDLAFVHCHTLTGKDLHISEV
ncbi:MAG: Otogelin [Dactylosporangium sp.]|nr:Otogelin [Dactylosporangium sp.]